MTKRVQLHWNRSQDPNVQYYRVYRAESPIINEHNLFEHLVMRVMQPDVITPVHMERMKAKKISGRSYRLPHRNILFNGENGEVFLFAVYRNNIEETNFTLDKEDGVVMFDNVIDDGDIVEVTYTFDGIMVNDYEAEENLKDYYGPGAEDISPPSAPRNVSIEADFKENRIQVNWSQSDPDTKRFYYRIDAIVDEGNYSGLSEYAVALIAEPLADRPYIIEKSANNLLWRQIARVEHNVFYEYMINRIAPPAIKGMNLSYDLIPNAGVGDVTIKWIKPTSGVIGNSELYRVRAVNRLGAMSEPSDVVGPIPFQVGLKHILIRRKIDDGTLPTYDGSDAVTITEVTDFNTIFYIDRVNDNEKYIYGMWVVDHSGSYSPLTYARINVKDASPPSPPAIRSINEFKILVG